MLAVHALRPPARPLVRRRRGRRLRGLLTAVTLLSLAWSIAPDDTLKDAGRSLTYLAVFAASVAARAALAGRRARSSPGRSCSPVWP